MKPQADTSRTNKLTLSLYLKCMAALVLLLLSVLVVACGGSNTQASVTNPAVTVTINLGNNNASPLPTLTPYSCGAWATNTSPAYNATSTVAVYAKYIHNVDGNPEGIDAASATAVIHWGDGTADTLTTNTTSDGLAVFNFDASAKGSAIGKLTLVTITFIKDGTPGCTVGTDRAAFFTLVVASPTASSTPKSDNNGNNNGNNGNGNNGNGNGKKKKHG